MTIHLIRHAETVLNASRIVQFPETPLSVRGERQAEALAQRLRDAPISLILSSDYARARATAGALARTTGARTVTMAALRERHFGEHRGRPWTDPGIDMWSPAYGPPGGERLEDFEARVSAAWQRVLEAAADLAGDLAVVTHGLVCQSVARRHLDVPVAGGETLVRWRNTCVTAVDPDAVRPLLHLANADHLAGMPDEHS